MDAMDAVDFPLDPANVCGRLRMVKTLRQVSGSEENFGLTLVVITTIIATDDGYEAIPEQATAGLS